MTGIPGLDDDGDDYDDSSESDYADPDGEEEDVDVQQQQQPIASPPQSEDPRKLVRHSERGRIPSGKYHDYILSCSTAVKNPPQFSELSKMCDEPSLVDGAAFNEPVTFQEAIGGDDSDQWKEAMQLEYDALLKNCTWELTNLPSGRTALRSKWVYKVKTNSDGSLERFKARLVIKGYSQVKGVDYNETYAPVVRYATVRYLMSLAAKIDLKVLQMDAVTAFLQGELEEDEIFMEQPEGFVSQEEPAKVCKLKKALYGLKQASRVWNLKLDTELKRIGLQRSQYDTCVYFKNEGKSVLIVAVYVDDLLIFSNKERWEKHLKQELTKKFKMKDLGLASKVLGIRVTIEDGVVRLDQEQYIKDLLKRFRMAECNATTIPAEPGLKLSKQMGPKSVEERKRMKQLPFRELIGGLQYLAQCTRPDISFAVNAVSHFCNDPGITHWEAAKRILKYLKGTKQLQLVYNGRCDDDFVGFCDADWGSDIDTRRSVTGYVLMHAGGPITWNCRKQTTVAKSTMEAEYMALSAVTEEVIWWRGFRQELSGCEKPVTIFCDNKSAIHLVEKEISYSPRSKHIDIRHHFIRQHIHEKQIQLEHVRSEKQRADVLTKALPSIKFQDERKALGIRDILG